MKHDHITNKTLQAAVDAAFKAAAITDFITDENHAWWKPHVLYRLNLARALLDALPDPVPPVVDGKTPGQLNYETGFPTADGYYKWELLNESEQREYEAAAQAVIATFGNQSLDSAIARMEAVDVDDLRNAFFGAPSQEEFKAVRARLIAAVREGQAVPSPDYKLAYAHAVEDVVIWKTKHEDAQKLAEKWGKEATLQLTRAEKAEAELVVLGAVAKASLSQLRPIAEAGPVPDGCVRVYGHFNENVLHKWSIGSEKYRRDTHFADIRLPEGKPEPTPEPLVTKPDSLPKWTPAVGDLVQLKSGGPVMTFDFAEHDDVYNDTVYNCMWIKPCGNPSGLKLPLHMLKPAKEEQL